MSELPDAAPQRKPVLTNAERAERLARLVLDYDLAIDFGKCAITFERHKVILVTFEETFKPTLTTPTVQQTA